MDMKLSEAIDNFLLYQQVRKNRPKSTIDTYRSCLRLFRGFCGDIILGDLTPTLVDDYARHIEQYNFASKTFYNKLTPIRSMVKHYYSKGIISMHPESIDLPTIEDTEANFLTPEEQVRMAKACKDVRELAIFLILTRSAIRVSELVNLKTDDIYDRSVIIRRGKGKKSRITFLTADAICSIERYHSTLAFEPEYVICGISGKQLSRQYIWQVIKRIAIRAGITKNISPHTMRHTGITNLLMNGMSIQDAQKIAGHVNIQTTLIYAHFTNDYLKGKYDEATPEMLVAY